MPKIPKNKKLIISIKIIETTYKINDKKLIIFISYSNIIIICSWNYINIWELSYYISLHSDRGVELLY